MSIRSGVRDLLRLCGHALTSTVHERLDWIEQRLDNLESHPPGARSTETDAALLQASIHMIENLHALAGRVVVETGLTHASPAAALLAFLYSHLPNRAAIEMPGCNNLSLAEAGYEVYAFDDNQPSRETAKGLASMITAVGARAPAMRAGAGLAAGLQIEHAIPKEIGLLVLGGAVKGDTPTSLRETGDFGASVIVADIAKDFAGLVAEMRSRDYHWHVALYRSPARDGPSYFANYPGGVPDAEGSVFFFRAYRVFAEAQAWCAATLPRTYFKPPQV